MPAGTVVRLCVVAFLIVGGLSAAWPTGGSSRTSSGSLTHTAAVPLGTGIVH